MSGPPRPRTPWMLVGAGALLVLLLLYTLFVAYFPARQRIARLEDELKGVYAREAELQTRVAQLEERLAPGDRQLAALRTERDALARRVADLQRDLAAARRRR